MESTNKKGDAARGIVAGAELIDSTHDQPTQLGSPGPSRDIQCPKEVKKVKRSETRRVHVKDKQSHKNKSKSKNNKAVPTNLEGLESIIPSLDDQPIALQSSVPSSDVPCQEVVKKVKTRRRHAKDQQSNHAKSKNNTAAPKNVEVMASLTSLDDQPIQLESAVSSSDTGFPEKVKKTKTRRRHANHQQNNQDGVVPNTNNTALGNVEAMESGALIDAKPSELEAMTSLSDIQCQDEVEESAKRRRRRRHSFQSTDYIEQHGLSSMSEAPPFLESDSLAPGAYHEGNGGSQLPMDTDLDSLVPANSTSDVSQPLLSPQASQHGPDHQYELSGGSPMPVIHAHVVVEEPFEELLAAEIEARVQAELQDQVEQEVNRTLRAIPTAEVKIVDGKESLATSCTKWWLWVPMLLLLSGAILGIVFGVRGDPTPPTASFVGVAPTSQFFCQVGDDLNSEFNSDRFGYGLALSSDGTRVAIGAPYNIGDGVDTGQVSIFDWSGSHWIQVGSVLDGETNISDWFGLSVALSSDGSHVAIGAPHANQNGEVFTGRYLSSDEGNGFVRIFDWSGSNWTQVGSDLNGEAVGESFGWSVDFSSDGTRVAIGAPHYRYADASDDTGYVRIFYWSGSHWDQVGSDLDDEASGTGFGWSVALSSDGSRVAIGKIGYNDDTGIVYIFDWSGNNWTQVGSAITGEAAYDRFGISVALSSDGNRVAIGACQCISLLDAGDGNGYVSIFDWSGSDWTQAGSTIIGETSGDAFGYSVGLSADGKRVAIGAPYNNQNGDDAGQVSIFDWSGSNWTQVGSVINGETDYDRFGTSVALSAGNGSHVAINAPYHAGSDLGLGQVVIYNLKNSSCAPPSSSCQVGLDLYGEENSDLFGSSVALSSDGNRVAISAPNHNDYAGQVRIFDWSGTDWIQVGSDLDGEAADWDFGTCVALSEDGNWVAVSARYYTALNKTGVVYVFNWSGSDWIQVGSGINGEANGDNFGWSVALSSNGTRVAIGAPYKEGFIGVDAGLVRIFDWSGSQWVQVGSDLVGEAADDQFGHSVALSADGNRVAISAIAYNVFSGKVYIYDWSGSSWTQVGPTLLGKADTRPGLVSDVFGFSVALSLDGHRVAIGAPQHLGGMVDTDDVDGVGFVRILDWSGSNWTQVGSDLYGNANDGAFGFSVGLSSDGTRVAAGAPHNEFAEVGDDSDYVTIFDWSGSQWVPVGPNLIGEAAGDTFGWSVALSGDGNQVAIGAPYNNQNGDDAGQVATYNLKNSSCQTTSSSTDSDPSAPSTSSPSASPAS